jgi:hypothetical protein
MAAPAFPLDDINPLERTASYVESAQTFIRNSWLTFNNDASQIFERGTAIVTGVAPSILDLMSPASSRPIRPDPPVMTRTPQPDPTAGMITLNGCKKWCNMELGACEREIEGTNFLALAFLAMLLISILILLFRCCCRGRKTADRGTQFPESDPANSTGIEGLNEDLAQQKKDCEKEKAKLQKRLDQQQEQCAEEKLRLQRQLDQANKDNDLLKAELRAAGPSAAATDKDVLIRAQRDRLQDRSTQLQAERGRNAQLMNDNAVRKQAQTDLIQEVDQLKRDLAEAKQKSLDNAQECADEKDQLERDLAKAKQKSLDDAQECADEKDRLCDEIANVRGQLDLAILRDISQPNNKDQATQTPTDQATQTQTDQATQTSAGQATRNSTSDRRTQTEGTAGTNSGSQLPIDTNASTNTASQAPSNQERLDEGGRVARAEREHLRLQAAHGRYQAENALLQRQYDTARADNAHMRRANEGRANLEKALEDLTASSKGVEQTLEELNNRCPHNNNGCDSRGPGGDQRTLEDLIASSKVVEQTVREINEKCPHGNNVREPARSRESCRSRHSFQQPSEEHTSVDDHISVDGEVRADCNTTRCHECPWYPGEKHHICVTTNSDLLIKGDVPEPILPEESTVPGPGPAPPNLYPSSTPPSPVPLPPVISGAPPNSIADDMQKGKGSLPILPSAATDVESKQRLDNIRADFRRAYEAFEAQARTRMCPGLRHTRKLVAAAIARYASRKNIDVQTWTPGIDLDNLQTKCLEAMRSWAEGHEQDRKHLAGRCSQDEIAKSRNCLPADAVDTGVDVDSEEETEEAAVPAGSDPRKSRDGRGSISREENRPAIISTGPDPNKSTEDDLDSLFGEGDEPAVSPTGPDPIESEDDDYYNNLMGGSDDETTISGLAPIAMQAKNQGKLDPVTPRKGESDTSVPRSPPPAPFKPQPDPKVVAGRKLPTPSDVKIGNENPSVTLAVQTDKPKTPTKPSTEPASPGSAASELSSNVPPTPEKGDSTDEAGQPSSEKPGETAPFTDKPSDPVVPKDAAPLLPPSLPLPIKALETDAIEKYLEERGHEFTRLPTDGTGFLCGVNAVGLTAKNMHPEIEGLTAAALMDVLDWPDYRAIVDDPRFAYRDDLGQVVTPTNREFFAVDQLASMIGLWGSRRSLDLRLGVYREDYEPSVYGGVREGRTVILWIHHDNNEERTRNSEFPMVDHFSGYKRVPADTEDEAQAKKDAADKEAQALRDAESKAKQDAESLAKQNADHQARREAKKNAATGPPKKDAEGKSKQKLQKPQDKKKR